MRTLFRRLGYVLRHSRRDADLREEIETHRALRQEALERAGMETQEAVHESRRALGSVTLAVEDVRDVWMLRVIDATWHDVRAAFRGLQKSPAFSFVAIATLALGIGANTGLFSIFNSLMLRPLPVRDPGTLVLLTGGSWTYPIWEEIRRYDAQLFDGAFAWAEERFDLSQGGVSELVDGAYVSGALFDVLGVSGFRGRMLTPEDDADAPDGPVAVISHRFWQKHFGGTDDVLGRQLTLQRVPFTVVGIMPPGFFGPDVGRTADVMIPFAAEPLIRRRESALGERSMWWVEVMVRLQPGQSIEQATAALRGVQPQIRYETLPKWPEEMLARYLDTPFTLVPATTGKSDLRGRFETPLRAMVVAVGLVLLVACANIASLLLARALARRRELSVRLALGASRWRIARLLLAESLMVATAGAALGLLFAKWSSALLVRQLATWRSAVFLDLTFDWRVLGFTALLACASAIIAGVAPVLGVKSIAPNDALKDVGRGIAGDRRFAVRGTLVVAQIAVSLVLLVAAGLFLRTFVSLTRVPLGFVPEDVVVVALNLQPSTVPRQERGVLTERLREAVTAVPGVRSAAVSVMTPVSGSGWNNWVGDSPSPPRDRNQMTWINAITPGWFTTMGIPLLSGRDFEPGDRTGGGAVAIVNETFAARFLLGQPPIGQTVRLGAPGGGTPYVIVGLARDAVYRSPREGMVPTIYLPLAQREQLGATLALTARAVPGQRATVERGVAAALTRVDPAIAFTFRTFDQLVDATVTQERLVALLSTFFGGLALLLAGIGLYGVVARAVEARRTEIGIRVALGAAPAGIVRLVLRRIGLLIAAGFTIGIGLGLWAAAAVQTMLFQLDARDPTTFAIAAIVLVSVGMVAAWVPARRAARLDPATVLREG
ncbi:MAG TPA: ABC transporter permease [Vicinamibacterales bacterium]|nr:ABC transporter permease [Vicinamibacterales bacterium]